MVQYIITAQYIKDIIHKVETLKSKLNHLWKDDLGKINATKKSLLVKRRMAFLAGQYEFTRLRLINGIKYI